ncbi:MAG: hypothetical protein ACT4OE_03385 [Sphingosinicella sp.]
MSERDERRVKRLAAALRDNLRRRKAQARSLGRRDRTQAQVSSENEEPEKTG